MKPNGRAQPNGSQDLPADAVRAELHRILASDVFSNAERPSRFLQFLVESALDGNITNLDEKVLAVEICNRRSTFDPSLDAIVRVEAGRLRRKLLEYYQGSGRADPTIIELPKRTYVPVFHARNNPPVRSGSVPAGKFFRSASWTTALVIFAFGMMAGLLAFWGTGVLDRKSFAAPPDSGTLSIVVLPFTDLSPDHDQDYFCDGVTEELTEALTKVAGLRVVARTTAFHLKGKSEDVRKIGKRLNVDLVLQGSVRKGANRVRIAVDLIDAGTGYGIWSRTYDREAIDIFAIEDDVARAVVAMLWAEVRKPRPAPRPGGSLEADRFYRRGLSAARQWTIEGMTEALQHFEMAAAKDPRFAAAHAALAECYALLGIHAGLSPDQAMPKAKAAAIRALELDDSLALAHTSLGLVKAVYEWDWNAAEESFRHALASSSADASDHEMYALGYLVPQGRLADALEQIYEARSEDPLSSHIESLLGMIYYYRREYDLAIKHFQKPLQLDTHFETIHLGIGSAYEQKARFAEAIASLHEGIAAWRYGPGTSMLGHTYALMGRKAEANDLIQQLVELSKTRYISPVYIATIYAGLGDKDQTMVWLDRAYQVRAASLVFLKVNPRFDRVRSDPRFQSLLRKIHLD